MTTAGKDGLLRAMLDAYLMEKGTSEFYDTASARAADDGARGLFKSLALWEREHMGYIRFLYHAIREDRETVSFEEFRKKVSAEDVESGLPAMETAKAFDVVEFKTDAEAIGLALDMEERAAALYARLSTSAEDANTREFMKDMAALERKHIEFLKKFKGAKVS